MVKTKAEVQRDYRRRHSDALKEKERLRGKLRRSIPKSDAQMKLIRERGRIRMRVCRANKKEALSLGPGNEAFSPIYKSKSSQRRAVIKAKQSLPKSPRKRSMVVRSLAVELGIREEMLAAATIITRQRLKKETVQAVVDFYLREDISRWTPGMKEYVKVGKEKRQKRYLLMTLRETFALYEMEPHEEVVKFSKFCELRPKEVITYGKTPLEACCCLIHKNFINLCDPLAIKLGFDRYSKDWVEKYVLCDPVTAACFNLECDVCSEGKLLRVDAPPADGEDQQVTYVWWQNDDVTNRVNKTSVTKSVTDAFECFTMYIMKFTPHHLIKRKQAVEFRRMKEGLDDADVLLHFDFAENFSCSHQEAIQSAYWCQSQVSIFTVAVYRKDADPEMRALITDLTDHTKTTIVVYLEYLLNIYAVHGSNILLWSDGPSSQFKNRFMARFMEMSAEKHSSNISWNFFATSHGKGAVDGVGGVLKRRAWNKVKARQVVIRNAAEFTDAVKDGGIICNFLTKEFMVASYAEMSASIESAEKVGILALFPVKRMLLKRNNKGT